MPSHYNPDELSKLHKTLSKSFGLQRKTLRRVLGLEGRVSRLEGEEESVANGVKSKTRRISADKLFPNKKKKESVDEREFLQWHKDSHQIKTGAGVIEAGAGEVDESRGVDGTAGVDGAAGVDGDVGASGTAGVDGRYRLVGKKIRAKDLGYRSRVEGKDSSGEYQTPRERKLSFRRSKIKAEQFKKGSSVEGAEKVSADARGESGTSVDKSQNPPLDFDSPAEATPTTESQSPVVSDALKKSVNAIAGSVDGIKQILLEGQKEDKEAAADARRSAEESEQKKREKGLESKAFDGLKKVGEKILQPVKSLWDRILNFITTVFLGRVMVKLIEWLGNPANMEKLSNFFRFLIDWWPVIVAGLLAFASPLLGPMGVIAGITALVIWGVSKIWGVVDFIKNLPGKIWNFLTGGPKEDDDPLKGQGPLGGMPDLKGETDDQGKPSTDVGDETPAELAGGEEQQQQLGAIQEPGSDMEFNKGGPVPGSGNKDTVPAMLTPGEFVMTQEAVEKYGTNTLEGMNAAAASSGSSIPQVDPQSVRFNAKNGKDGESGGIQYKNVGGMVNRTRYYSSFNPSVSRVQHFNKGGVVQYFNKGGKVKDVDPKTGEKKRGGLIGKLVETVRNMMEAGPEGGAKSGFMKGGPIGALIGGGLGVVGEAIGVGGGGGGAQIDISANGKGVPDIQPPDTEADVELATEKAAAQAQKAQSSPPTGNTIPTFSAETMVSSAKIRTLGITV